MKNQRLGWDPADVIRNGLRKSAALRLEADALRLRWLKEAQANPDIRMGEAAALAGLKSRQGAYHILRHEKGS